MSLKIWVKAMFFITVIALIYIHMQVQIFDLAYQAKDKEKLFHESKDRNGILTHKILTLKSANHLGNSMLEKDSTLQFMSFDHILTLSGPKPLIRSAQGTAVKANNLSSMWNFLSFLAPKEAKAWDRE